MQRCVRGARPPTKPALGEAAETEPETLAIINEQFERRAQAVAKNKEGAGERVFCQLGLAQGDERINALAEVNRLASEQDSELRNELNHGLQEWRKSAQRVESEAESRAGRRMVNREPSGRSSSSRQSERAAPIGE